MRINKKYRALVILLLLLLLTLSVSITLTLIQEQNSILQRHNQTQKLSMALDDLDEATALAVQLMNNNDLNRAEEILLVIIDKYPENSDHKLLLGTVYFRQKRYDRAEHTFRTVLLEEPDNAAASNNLGETLIKLNRLPEAAEAIDNAVKIAPDNADIMLNAANIHAMLGEDADALKYLVSAMRAGISTEEITRHKDLVRLMEKPEIMQSFQFPEQQPNKPED